MINRHFLKRLFQFVLIIALGALLSLVVNYFETKDGASASASLGS